jgi:hypothetical protein
MHYKEVFVMHSICNFHRAETIKRRKVKAAFQLDTHIGTLEGETSAGLPVFNLAKPIPDNKIYAQAFYGV